MVRTATLPEVDAVAAAFNTDRPAQFAPGAHWIWDDGEPNPRNAWRFFRRSFDCEAAPGPATLRITADTRYVVWVNGGRVGQGPVRGFRRRWMVDAWPVDHLLRPGQPNAIAVLVLNYGVPTFNDVGNRGGVLAELTLPDGERLVTDAAWKVATPPGYDPRSNRMSCQLAFSEFIDARLMPDRWTEPGFDDGEWAAAAPVARPNEEPWPRLVERDIPHLAEQVTRPTHVERLARVRPFSETAVIDLRTQMEPASIAHANHVAYSGYLVTLIRLAADDEVVIAIPWSRFNGLGVDGHWRGLDALTSGPGTQRSLRVPLTVGDHWLVIDVSRGDHGDGFQVALDSAAPGTATFASPLGDDAETPFVTVGSFGELGEDWEVFPEVSPIPGEVKAIAETLASGDGLARLAPFARPVPAALVSPADLFTLSSQPRERTEQPVPASLQAIVSGNPVSVPVSAGRDTELIFDLGREFSGYVAFDIESPAGVTVDCYGFEYLRGDHREDTQRLDNAFRYVTREGRQRYVSPTRRGLRFLQVTFRGLDVVTGEVRLHDLAMIESHYPVSRVGRFRCSDARLDDIWELCRRTVLACMEDTYVDCPAYEQTYWVGDAYNSARFATALFGVEALTERCLRLVPGSAGQTPLFASQVPSGWVNVIPNWTFFWVLTCRNHWFRTGDDAFAADLWPAIEMTLNAFAEHLNADGLLEIEAWNLLDWAALDQPNSGVVTHQNCLMVMALDAAAELAGRCGADPAPMRQRAKRLRAAIDAHLWSDDAQGYIDCIHADGRRSEVFSVQAHMFALLAGIPSGERAARVRSVLVDPPAGWVRIGTPWMSAFLYDVLADLGRTAEALTEIRHNYGQMLDHDATTCWEMYPESRAAQGSEQLTRSHCHAWSGAPAAFLPDRVLGIRALAPGWSRVLVAPEPCGLEWADGSVPLPDAGKIDVAWRIDGPGRIRIEVDAPCGIEIDARLPHGHAGDVIVNGVAR